MSFPKKAKGISLKAFVICGNNKKFGRKARCCMCYYISITPKMKDIEERFGVVFQQSESYHPVYSASAFTFPKLPVISNDSPKAIELFQWGLIPSWIKDNERALTIRQRTLNARSETIFQRPAFRHSIRSKRCLIIADGFFEWRHENNKKYPYYIELHNHVLFTIAGIWDSWENPITGETVKTFSVVTTRANALLEKVHNTRKRMPVILKKDNESVWLAENLDEHQIKSILNPYDAKDMQAFTVAGLINKLGYNDWNTQVTEEYSYPELSKIDK